MSKIFLDSLHKYVTLRHCNNMHVMILFPSRKVAIASNCLSLKRLLYPRSLPLSTIFFKSILPLWIYAAMATHLAENNAHIWPPFQRVINFSYFAISQRQE